MNFDDILKAHGRERRQLVYDRLYMLGNELFKKNKWEFIYSYGSEMVASKSNKDYRAGIAKMPLIYECGPDFDMCNKAGYVSVVQSMYHEKRHINQYIDEWNNPPPLKGIANARRMTNVIRRGFVRDYFPSSYTSNYTNDPGEMDAETYGIEQALEYFKSDPIVTYKEAREILFELMTSETYHSRKIFEEHSPKSIDDVLDIFKERRDKSVYEKYTITLDVPDTFNDMPINETDMTKEFLELPKFESFRKAFDECKDGLEQDKVLEQAILYKFPDAYKRVPRIREELLDCKRQMDIRIINRRKAIPPAKINYAKAPEELELTDEDVASISNGEEIKL